MGHLDNFRNVILSFGKSYIEQLTISQIQHEALVNLMSSSRQFDKYNLQLQQIRNQAYENISNQIQLELNQKSFRLAIDHEKSTRNHYKSKRNHQTSTRNN